MAPYINFHFQFQDAGANNGTARQIHDVGAGAAVKPGRQLP